MVRKLVVWSEMGKFEVKEDKITRDDFDEMIFIIDVFYITDNGYHEMAQRHKKLPRACGAIKRRHQLNETCEIFDLDGEYEGVYKSLKAHLTRNLSNPSKVHLIKDNKVKIKLSGDGTRAGTKNT